MWKDPLVDEIRAHRESHAAKFNYDLAAICRDLRQQQASSGRRIVSLPAKRVQGTDRARQMASDSARQPDS